ncbi:hypothetical protein LCGC14_0912270 [marine sediment metagenome]|uniref:Uncharacterized protein n=1 Tax=marine sediment metagenome TaxID=412755 RepID=A0A0F9NT66_9ZZZZ
MITEEQTNLLEKVNGINNRLSLLKQQGESSNNKTLKSMRTRRNRFIKELVELLQPTADFYESNKKKDAKDMGGEE